MNTISCSALFCLHAFPQLLPHNSQVEADYCSPKLQQLSVEMTQLSEHLLNAACSEQETLTVSPYISYALYPTASIQLRLWSRTGDQAHKDRADVMIAILKQFNKRWRIAG